MRALSSQIVFWVVTAFFALLAADAAVRGAWLTLGRWGPPGLLILWALWLVLRHSCVRVSSSGVTVQNLLRRHMVPWRQITHIVTGPQMVIELSDSRRISCWGAPFPNRPGARASARDHTPGPQADLLRSLEQYRDSDPSATHAVRAHSEWDRHALIAGVALTIMSIISITVTAR